MPKRCRRNCKQCRLWSDCSSSSSLIWVYSGCSGLLVQKLRIIMVTISWWQFQSPRFWDHRKSWLPMQQLCLVHRWLRGTLMIMCFQTDRSENRSGYISRRMTKPTKWPVRLAKTLISLGIRPVWSQSFRCPHEETLGPYLPIERTLKTLIRLDGCPDWSDSSLCASHFVGFVVLWLI